MSRAPVAVAALLLLSTLLVGCGSEEGPTSATAPESSETSGSPTAEPTAQATEKGATIPRTSKDAAPVPETLRFTATEVGGEGFDGATLAGKPVLLWFWAPWCPQCRSQIPQVERLAAEHGDDLGVVGVGSLDSEAAIAEFARGVDGVTHLVDTEGALWRKFGVAEQSSFVLLDADGQVTYEVGYGGSDELGQQVAAVVG